MENLVKRTIVNTEERERERISKDLHDNLGHRLSAIISSLSTLGSNHDYNAERTKKIFFASAEQLQSMHAELRRICKDIMPPALRDFGLTKALDDLCKNIELTGKIKFKRTVDESISLLDKLLQTAVFRIIQEFISNSLRHGKAKNIEIYLQKNSTRLNGYLKDDGIGFDAKKLNKKKGMGLMNMKSRAESFNGEIKIESSPGKGTIFFIEIPLQ